MRNCHLIFTTLGILLAIHLPLASQVDPDQKDPSEACKQRLVVIGKAIVVYQRERGDLPEWLSDLWPKYLPDEDLLRCPGDRDSSGDSVFKSNADPRLPVSYGYQFHPAYRRRKTEQRRMFGDMVPLVRCRHHQGGKEPDVVLNLSFASEIYRSPGVWEKSPRALRNLHANVKRLVRAGSRDGRTDLAVNLLVPGRSSSYFSLLSDKQRADLARFARSAAEKEPENGVAYKLLGTLELLDGKETAALATFEKAMSLLPKDAETFSIVGEFYDEENRVEDAIRVFEAMLGLGAGDERFLRFYPRLCSHYRRAGRDEAADALIDRVREMAQGSSGPSSVVLVDMLIAAERYSEARGSLEQRVKENPDDFFALSKLSDLYGKMGSDRLKSEYRAKAVLALNPGMSWLGKALPDFSATDLQGEPISLRHYRGKVVLMEFWATWCGSCVTKMPEIKAVYEKYRNRGFDVIGVSLDSNEARLRAFVKKHALPWRQILGGQGAASPLARKYGIRGVPTLWLLDEEGKLISARTTNLDKAVAAAIGR